MANVKISELPAASAAVAANEFEINEAGTSKKVTGTQVAAFVEGVVSSAPSFTGQVSLADGSAAAPSLSNTGDLNTGLLFPAADTVGVSVGGTQRLTVGTSGVTVNGDLATTTSGTSNFVAGVNAGNSIASGGNYNVAVGDEAGTAITTGDRNTAVGFEALKTATTAQYNTAIGYQALEANTGNNNTAVGDQALEANIGGANNSALGDDALVANTTGSYNTAMGASALAANTTASANTAVGYQAGYTVSTSPNNVTVGYQAGYSGTTGLGNNVAIGSNASYAQTTGNNNVTVGVNAGLANTTGSDSAAVGPHALKANTTGYGNHAFGYASLYDNTTGANNTAVGYSALANNTTASYNIAVGYQALLTNTTGAKNTAFGYTALRDCTVGTSNIGIGYEAGSNITDGDDNICIGYAAGSYQADLTTGGQNTLVGNYIIIGAADATYANAFGYNLTAAAGYTTLGKGSTDIRAEHGVATWATVSDERYKKDIVNSTAGLSFIKALQPRTFKYKTLGELPETFSAYEADSTEVFKNSNTNHGFIAQEVKAAIDADSSLKDGFRLWDDRDDGSQEVAEAALIPMLVKAIQELSATNDALAARITALEGA